MYDMRWALIAAAAFLSIACGGSAGDEIAAITAPPAAATAVVTPTATVALPTSTPTPVPPQASVQLGAWQVRAAPNAVQVLIEGEAVNEGDADAQEITVAIRLYDAGGTIIASERAYLVLSIIPAGGMSPFLAYVNGIALEDVDETRIDIQFKTFDENSYHGFTYSLDVEIAQLRWMEDRIVGELRNTDVYPLRNVTVAIIGYDENGGIVSVERATMDSDQVEPGMTAGFSNRFASHDTMPATWVAVAQGSRVR
jgi:hypothetical protein